jgi:hypothetical protein
MNKVKFKLRPVIDAVYPFADAISAFRHWNTVPSARS